MSLTQDFIETSIAHQFGGATKLSTAETHLERGLKASSNMTLLWRAADQAPAPLNAWNASDDPTRVAVNARHKNAYKCEKALASALAAGLDFDLLVDMQDHRTRSLTDDGGVAPPLICFNRPSRKQTGRTIWPLPVYHDVDSGDFLGGLSPSRVAWDDKTDMTLWRGGPGNRGRLGKWGRGRSIRLAPLLSRYKAGELSAEETERALLTMPRYRLLDRWIDDKRMDIGYTDSDGFNVAREPFLARFKKPRIPREAFQQAKRILVVPGNDVGSSFYWTMNSGSVGLVVDVGFETFASCHFRRWEHFVPVRADLADLDAMIAWCDGHVEDCKAMAARAAEVCKLLGDIDLRRRVNKGLIDRMRSAISE